MQKKVIIGLGNPGKKYQLNRHNIGFMLIDALSQAWSIPVQDEKKNLVLGEGRVGQNVVSLVKPSTFMNDSGKAVNYFVNYLKVPSENIMVVYDDFSLDFLKCRVRLKGRAGGHNGIKSIINFIGEDFPRIKMGIGEPWDRDNITGFVLSDFTKRERELLPEIMGKATAMAEHFVDNPAESLFKTQGSY
jgi:peptidyl-tRNA hydrolase, PTH1 family